VEYYEAEKARKEKIRQKKSAKELKDAKDAARRLAEEEFKTKLSSSSRFQQMLAEREAVRCCPGHHFLLPSRRNTTAFHTTPLLRPPYETYGTRSVLLAGRGKYWGSDKGAIVPLKQGDFANSMSFIALVWLG
jgi:hypothetical protein